MKIIERFWNWIDSRGVIRRVILGIAIWMTWQVSEWAMAFSTNEEISINTAAVIAAVSSPIVAFGGYVFKAYLDSRDGA